MGCAGSPVMTAIQLLTPPIDKIAENVKSVTNPKPEGRSTDGNGCTNYWVHQKFTKSGTVCYTSCMKEISCDKH
jgi:hypothetical protein